MIQIRINLQSLVTDAMRDSYLRTAAETVSALVRSGNEGNFEITTHGDGIPVTATVRYE